MKIIIDSMGSDLGVLEILKGINEYLKESRIEGYLVGNPSEIEKNLIDFPKVKEYFSILPASQVINNTDDPAYAIRKKKDSSIVVGMKAVASGKGDGFLSAGSTGGLLAGGLFLLGRIQGVERAALPTFLPSVHGGFLLIDSGANMDCTKEQIFSFAQMGKVYSEKVLHKNNPKIGLLSVGKEPGKGNQLVKDSYEILEQSKLNFIGNIEARDVFFTEVDVVVCDGFAGNIMLKNTEGVAFYLMHLISDTIQKKYKEDQEGFAKIGKILKEISKDLDYSEHGGAPLLGLKAPVIKAHGSSNYLAFKNAIRQMEDYLNKGVINTISKDIEGELR